jgi:hypothetical protein
MYRRYELVRLVVALCICKAATVAAAGFVLRTFHRLRHLSLINR